LTIVAEQTLNIIVDKSESGSSQLVRLFRNSCGQQILLRAYTDYYGGENLSQSVMTIEDTIPHFSSEMLASCALPHKQVLCEDNIFKFDSKYHSSYSRYFNLTPLVASVMTRDSSQEEFGLRSCKNSLQEEFCDTCTLTEKCMDIASTEVNKGPLDILYGLILYGLLRCFLGFLMYGYFNINILLRKYTVKFFDDLARSRYNEFINAFNDPLINGFDKYFKYDLDDKCL